MLQLAHIKNEDLSRKDDLWSIFYIMVEMLEGSLPWTKLSDKEDIKNMKLSNPPENLIQNFPYDFENFVKHLNSLNFEDPPDYNILKGIIKGIIASNGGCEDSPFPWENITDTSMSSFTTTSINTFKLIQDKRMSFGSSITIDKELDDVKSSDLSERTSVKKKIRRKFK